MRTYLLARVALMLASAAVLVVSSGCLVAAAGAGAAGGYVVGREQAKSEDGK